MEILERNLQALTEVEPIARKVRNRATRALALISIRPFEHFRISVIVGLAFEYEESLSDQLPLDNSMQLLLPFAEQRNILTKKRLSVRAE